MHRQMEGGVLNSLQRCQHGALIPDRALLGVDLGGFTRGRRFVNQIPVNSIRKGGLQECVDFVNGRAGQQPLLLVFRKLLLLAVNVLTAWGLAQRGVELLDVVGAEVLHLPLADIRHDEVLHHRHGLRVGLWRPLVLAGLNGNPLVEHLLHRHCIWHEECTIQQFLFDRDLALLRFGLGLEGLPAFAGLAIVVFVVVSDRIRVATLHNRCHRYSLPQTAANQSSKLCLLTRMLVPRRITLKSFVVLHRLYAARLEIAKSWAISSTR